MAEMIEKIKELREKTGAGMGDCKTALAESNGDMENAAEWLMKKGAVIADKKSARTAKEGLIYSYIHANGKLGSMIEINCETDFVARTEEFQELAKEIAMQVAAMMPLYVKREEVPAEVIEKEKEIYRAQVASSGKPPQVVDKIVAGKLEKYYKETCLMEQAYIKDDTKTIESLIKEKIAKIGENIVVKRFVRFQIGGN